jgi:hypothetical protein
MIVDLLYPSVSQLFDDCPYEVKTNVTYILAIFKGELRLDNVTLSSDKWRSVFPTGVYRTELNVTAFNVTALTWKSLLTLFLS